MSEANAINGLAQAVTNAGQHIGTAIVIAAFVRGFLK